jgi:RNA polymerase sigma-70 factor (ECF subfamily)
MKRRRSLRSEIFTSGNPCAVGVRYNFVSVAPWRYHRRIVDPKPMPTPTPAPRAALSDEASLLLAVGRGDRESFALLYDRVAPRLFGITRTILHDRTAAEDAVQDAFMQIWRRASTYDPARADAIVWMMLIARGKAIDALRRRGSASSALARVAALGAPRFGAAAGADEATERRSDRDAALRALAGLSPEQREAITLAYFGGMTGAEIAHARDLPLGTVKTRIRTGLERLREAFVNLREVSA